MLFFFIRNKHAAVFYLLLSSSLQSLFNTIWLKDQGLLVEPEGMSIFPSSYKLKKVSIAFPKIPQMDPAIKNCIDSATRDLLKELHDDITSLTSLFSGDDKAPMYDYCAQNSFLCNNSHLFDKSSDPLPTPSPMFSGIVDVSANENNTIPKSSLRRNKRFLMAAGLLLAGGLSIGSSIYTSVSISQIKDAVSEIHENMGKIREHINMNSKSIEVLKSVSKEHNLIIKATLFKVLKLDLELQCRSARMSYTSDLLAQLLNVKTKLVETCHDAITGKLTIGMIDPMHSYEIIKSDPDIKDTIYSRDLSIFYLSCRVYPIGFDPIAYVLHILLYIPIIKNEDMSPTYSVTNYGWIEPSKNAHYKLTVPKKFTIVQDPKSNSKQDLICIPVDLEKCESMGSFNLCEDEPKEISKEYSCMMEILNERYDKMKDSCEFSGRAYIVNEKVAVSTKHGVFLRGYKSYDITEIKRSASRTQTILVNDTANTFVEYSEFKMLSVEGKVVVSPLSHQGSPYYISLRFTSHNSSYKRIIDDAELKEDWIRLDSSYNDLNNIKTDYLSPFIWESNIKNPILWVLFVAIALISLVLLFWYLKNRRQQKKIRANTNNQAIALRTIARRVERSGH